MKQSIANIAMTDSDKSLRKAAAEQPQKLKQIDKSGNLVNSQKFAELFPVEKCFILGYN